MVKAEKFDVLKHLLKTAIENKAVNDYDAMLLAVKDLNTRGIKYHNGNDQSAPMWGYLSKFGYLYTIIHNLKRGYVSFDKINFTDILHDVECFEKRIEEYPEKQRLEKEYWEQAKLKWS